MEKLQPGTHKLSIEKADAIRREGRIMLVKLHSRELQDAGSSRMYKVYPREESTGISGIELNISTREGMDVEIPIDERFSAADSIQGI